MDIKNGRQATDNSGVDGGKYILMGMQKFEFSQIIYPMIFITACLDLNCFSSAVTLSAPNLSTCLYLTSSPAVLIK
jgi:hypothetical protein